MAKKWDQEKIEMCVGLYRQGFSQEEIASRMKAGQAHVSKVLREQSIECRYAPWPPKKVQKMVGLYRSGLSVGQTAAKMQTNRSIVRKYLRRYKIPIRPQAEATRKGSRHPHWQGGRSVGEYIYIRSPHHPHRNWAGYVLEHRLVMEKHLERYLLPEEVVHHENKNKHDNRIENLVLFSCNGDHLAVELKGKRPKWTEEGRLRIVAAHRRRCQEQRRKSHSKTDAPP